MMIAILHWVENPVTAIAPLYFWAGMLSAVIAIALLFTDYGFFAIPVYALALSLLVMGHL